jgi:hypothetical protein
MEIRRSHLVTKGNGDKMAEEEVEEPRAGSAELEAQGSGPLEEENRTSTYTIRPKFEKKCVGVSQGSL